MGLIVELYHGLLLGFRLSKEHFIESYVKVPLGIITMIAVLYGVNEIIILTTISFPSSVACMLLLYLFLIISSQLLGTHKTSKVVALINIPGGFALRWINIFFTPAFIPLPLSDKIGAAEALTIAAVFVFGFLIAMAVMAWFTVFLQAILKKGRKSDVARAEELNKLADTDLGATSTAVNGQSEADLGVGTSYGAGETTSKEGSKESSRTASRAGSIELFSREEIDARHALDAVPPNILDDIARGDEDEAEDAYRRSLNLSRKATLLDDIELGEVTYSGQDRNEGTSVNSRHTNIQPPSAVAQPPRTNPSADLKVMESNKLLCKRAVIVQNSTKERHVVIGQFLQKYFDYFVFSVLFIISLPIYFAMNYEMFFHLSVSIFTFLFMINVPPPKWKKFLHPVLCSVALSWFFYYIFALMKHENFLSSLEQYKTGRNYLQLFNHRTSNEWPGAGDVFSTLMDCSIVSLSIPMYTYRNDLRRHFFALLGPILLMTFSNFFIYPPLCKALGITAERSLGFAGRSVTLALGTPFVEALGGSQQLMACTTVLTGVLGALLGQFLLGPKVLRIREDDYVTRGITLGLNCSAIATAHLLSIDPRAGAMSSLAFCLFGTFMVILGSITPLAKIVQGWVGL